MSEVSVRGLFAIYEEHKRMWNEYYDSAHTIQETFDEWIVRMNDDDRLVFLWRNDQ